MKRFTLIIDGHNFFFRSLWSVFKQGKNKVLETQKDMDTYEKKLMIDFANVIKQMNPIINDIVFIEDSHSWRKDLLLQQEYKGNRKKNQDNIDKNGFNAVINSFTNTLNELGVRVSRVEQSEGDDLIYAWSESLFNDGRSSIIFSTDKDLNQLVKCVNDVHIIQYAPLSNKLYVSKESNDIIKSLDKKIELTPENLFGEAFAISIENDPFKKFVSGVIVEEVYPEFIRFMKIIGGDTSDNIFPVYYKQGNGETRSKGIGQKTTEKIYNEFSNKLGCSFNFRIYSNEDAMKMLCNIIYDVAKIKDDEFTKRMLLDNIITNNKLVSLTEESIPQFVIDVMNENIGVVKEKKSVVISKLTREHVFSKSRFKDYKTTIQINGIKGVVDDGDMSFIHE